MKILKNLAVLAIASTVLLAGCQNNFTGTTLDTTTLTNANSASRTNVAGIPAPTLTGPLVNTKDQTLQVSFGAGKAIDSATILGGISIYNLTEGVTAGTPYVRKTPITPTLQYVSNGVAFLSLDCTGATGLLEVFIDSTKLTAKNGALKLDLDGDNTPGEAGDDDYYGYIAVGTYGTNTAPDTITNSANYQRRPRAGMTLTGGFLNVAAANGVYDTFRLTYTLIAGDTSDYKSMFDSSVVLEKFAPSTNTWATVSPTATVYSTTTGDWTATIPAASEGDVYRARLTNISSLKTAKEFYGFTQRRSMDSRYSQEELVAPTKTSVTTAKELAVSGLDSQDLAFAVSTAFDASGLNGTIVIDLNLAVTGDKGLDLTTLSTSTLKIYDTVDNTVLNYVSYTTACTDPAYPAVPTRIILKLDPTLKSKGHAFNILTSAGLKTLGDADGTPAAGRYFGDSSSIDVPTDFIGFSILSADGATL
jgi:hypothetical protein